MQNDGIERTRLDRWLWATRFYKTRAAAANAIKRGYVMVNAHKAKASKMLAVNDVLEFRQAQLIFKPTVLALSEKRVSAKLASALYKEPQEMIDARDMRKLEMQSSRQQLINGKPNKKERRLQQAMKKAMR